MNPMKFRVHTALSAFSDTGMAIFHDPKIPNIKSHDLLNIANYYSVILNFGESGGALYGPLPVAYHTEYLLYVYTFEIKNQKVSDKRILKRDGVVPAFLLIFFPTAAESFTSKARDNISIEISNWLEQFGEVNEINKEQINILSGQIEAAIFKEQSQFTLSEIDEANVVLGKSVELLCNVVKYQDKPVKLLISGTDEILLAITRKAIIENNSSLITYYKNKDNKTIFKTNNIEGKILLTSVDNPTVHKHLSNDLDGIIHFANFSTPLSIETHTDELHRIIKQTSKNCTISFVISQTDQPLKISETRIPVVLQDGVGRSISLIDLGQPKYTISTSIIEFLDKVIESIGKKE
ncbi:MAG: hypothetical protein KAR08_00940 [Candidatus Heimdallarchaeota archaeon]|nr:hypothetical protein [Candidatus Heimdallarchaeota archaeon]